MKKIWPKILTAHFVYYKQVVMKDKLNLNSTYQKQFVVVYVLIKTKIRKRAA